MIIGSSGAGKPNAMLNLIKEQDNIDKSEPKYEFLIKKHEDAGTKHLNDSNVFIECSNTMDYNIDDYNPNKKRKN